MKTRIDSRYVLENNEEFERLERQSSHEHLSFERELEGFKPQAGSTILDAGCGSGIVSRSLALRFPDCRVTGVDSSLERIEQAKKASGKFANLGFAQGDLLKLDPERIFEGERFDSVVCRYVMEHMDSERRAVALGRLKSCMKPGGSIWLVDVDGLLSNLYPQSAYVREVINRVTEAGSVDLNVGRKLPHELVEAGFQEVSWRVRTIEVRDEVLRAEVALMRERFVGFVDYLAGLLGDKTKAETFAEEYLAAMAAPGAVLFYNMFTAVGMKPRGSLTLAG